MYLLDTNICIYAINGRHPNLTRRLLTVHPDDIRISSITVGEMEYGSAKSHWGERTRETMHASLSNFTVLPFTEKDAVVFGTLRAMLEKMGTPIGVLDAMIGAQGISNGLRIVTHNTGEFSRLPGAMLEDWVEPVS